jgi:YjjG family noncanonical pyrimidine nucleotidase
MAGYDLVLIDLDETLFDFKKAEALALLEACKAFKLGPLEPIAFEYERINKGLWNRLERGEIELPELKVERFRLLSDKLALGIDPSALSAVYIDHLSRGIFPFEGAEEICRYLAGKYPLVIVTNGIREVQLPRIRNSFLGKLVSAVVVSEEAGFSKPEPEIFEYALRAVRHRRREGVIMIGDSLSSDIQGGIGFGIDTCWVNLKGGRNETNIHPRFEVRGLGELRDIL